MSGGANEPIEFTRGDAERLKGIEVIQKTTCKKIDILFTKIDAFSIAHTGKHVEIDKQIEKNARFRRIVIKALLWVFSTSAGIGILTAGIKATGWLD